MFSGAAHCSYTLDFVWKQTSKCPTNENTQKGQNKCWWCTLCDVWERCAFTLVRFRNRKHLVSIQKTLYFGLKYLVLSPQSGRLIKNIAFLLLILMYIAFIIALCSFYNSQYRSLFRFHCCCLLLNQILH